MRALLCITASLAGFAPAAGSTPHRMVSAGGPHGVAVLPAGEVLRSSPRPDASLPTLRSDGPNPVADAVKLRMGEALKITPSKKVNVSQTGPAGQKEKIEAFSPAHANVSVRHHGHRHRAVIRLDADAPAYFVHISKCAGTSFKKEVGDILHGFINEYSEHCYPTAKQKHPEVKIWISMFRSPRQHVVSQYLECRYDDWGKEVTSGTAFPRDGAVDRDFASWIEHFKTSEVSDDFNCYQPWNMQVRAMTCDGFDAHHTYLHESAKRLEAAKRVVLAMQHVGLTELYHESLCLLQYKVEGKLPASCECGGPAPEHSHESHHVPPHDNMTITASSMASVDNMTELDKELYIVVADRVLQEIRTAEAATAKKILCDAKFAAFQSKTGYARTSAARVTPHERSMDISISGISDVPIRGFSQA